MIRATPPPPGEAERVRWLERRVEELVAARPALLGAKIGIAVVDLASGRTLVGRGADKPLNVASNTKLVTAAASLALLGPEYRWRTTLLVPEKATGDSVSEVWLRGAGDPTLDAAALWELAEELRKSGVKRVSGIVIDESFFDGVASPPAFDQKKEDDAFRAPVSAAPLAYNAITVRVKPAAEPGAPPVVILDPASDYLELKNEALTVADGRTTLAVGTKATGRGLGAKTQVVVTGQIAVARPDDPFPWEIRRKRVEHPTLFMASTLRAVLAQRGIKVTGKTRIVTTPPTAKLRVVATHASPPLTVVLRELGKHSNNFVAEIILKTIGAEVGGLPGTWEKGQSAVRAWLAGVGVEGFRYDNGSGLYDSNRFTALQMARVVRAAALDFRTGADFLSTLAVAGADGTLGARMEGTAAERYVRGKTGTLKGTSCLTAIAGSATGKQLVFSVLLNEIPDAGEAGRAARSLQDELAQTVVLFLE
jgi:D-alanyl-D-alanine carboxypeptidase/D-alanyl-D-alanine-endopeptidase (penicillin-binding protein 4)